MPKTKDEPAVVELDLNDTDDVVVEKPCDWSVYTVTYDLFPDSQGNASYIYTEADDTVGPSNWTSVVTGSAGTQTYTVGGQSTSALAYNVAPSALDTALKALSTVGTGNAAVVALRANYSIALTLGGVLSGVGAGGATVAVNQV